MTASRGAVAGKRTATAPAASTACEPQRARRVLIIWNKAGGGAGNAAARREVEESLDLHGLTAEIFDSPSEAATTERVNASLGEGFDAIVAAGGNGTVRWLPSNCSIATPSWASFRSGPQ